MLSEPYPNVLVVHSKHLWPIKMASVPKAAPGTLLLFPWGPIMPVTTAVMTSSTPGDPESSRTVTRGTPRSLVISGLHPYVPWVPNGPLRPRDNVLRSLH